MGCDAASDTHMELQISSGELLGLHLRGLKRITGTGLYLKTSLLGELELPSSSPGAVRCAFTCPVTLPVGICEPLGFPQGLRKQLAAFKQPLPKRICRSVA